VKYLVDANVLCEPTRPQPDPLVVQWLIANEKELTVDPIILGKIKYGIDLMASGKKKAALERWFQEGAARILCLPWDAPTAIRWAKLLADLKRGGLAMPIKDSMIAATALHHHLTVVTRNESDFRKAKVKILNPFGTA
jgi:hypothetical protein